MLNDYELIMVLLCFVGVIITAYLYLWLEKKEKKRQLYRLAETIGENRRLGYYDNNQNT